MFKNNPILFKDLLISLNSKVGKSLLIFFGLFYTLGFLLLLAEMNDEYMRNFHNRGEEFFAVVGVLQTVALCLIGFIRGLFSISAEKSQKTLESVIISKVHTRSLIKGKFLSIFSFVGLLLCIAVPFLSVGLLIGGIEIGDVLIFLIYSLSYITSSILLGMTISAFSKNGVQSFLRGIATIGSMILFLIFYGSMIDFLDLYSGHYDEFIGASLFPLRFFGETGDIDAPSIGGVSLHYILGHIALFGTIITGLTHILFRYLKRYQQTQKEVFSYLGAACLFVIASIMALVVDYGYFIFSLFFVLTAITLFFVLNDSKRFSTKTQLIFGGSLIIGMILMNRNPRNIFSRKYILLVLATGVLTRGSFVFFHKVIANQQKVGSLSAIVMLAMMRFSFPFMASEWSGTDISSLPEFVDRIVTQEHLNPNGYCTREKGEYDKERRAEACESVYQQSGYSYTLLYFIIGMVFGGAGILIGRRQRKV